MKVMIGFERSSTRPPTVRRAFGAGRTRSVSTPSWMIAVRLRKATGRRPAWKGVGATMRSASPKTIAMVAFFACTRNFSSSEGALELGIEADVAPVRAVVVLGVGDLPRLRKDLAEENRFAPARMPDDHVRREAALAQSERRLRRRAAPNEIGLGADRRREDARRRSPYTAPAHQRNAGELAAGDGRERSAIVTARRHRVSDQAELRREVVVHEQKAGHPGEGPSRRLLPAPERPGDLVRERLHDVGEHGALAGPDESFDGHPGDQPQAFEPSELALRERDPDDVIRGAGALVGREVGGDAADDAAELRRRALVEGREAQGRGLPDADLIDVLRRELRLDRQHIGFRHDQHDGLSGRDHPADRVDGRLVHHPVLRRSDIDALQLVLGRDLALDELGNLALDLAQVLGNLAAQILIDLQDLQLDLGNLALGLSGRGDELAALALEARGVALERRHALDLHEVLAPEIPDALELLADQLGFALLRRDLAGEALDLLLELRDALPELRLLAGPGALAELEQIALAGHRPGELGSPALATSSAGKTTVSTLSRSASSRARRDWSSFRLLTTMARFACVMVSSSRTTISPALTLSPSRARNSPTTPPVGCCTFLTFESTTRLPGAITAPDSSVVAASPPTPPARSATTARPPSRWLRIDRCAGDCALLTLSLLGFQRP